MKLVRSVLLLAVLLPLTSFTQAADERATTRKLEHREYRTQPTVRDKNGYQVVPRDNSEANRFINSVDEQRKLDQQIRDEQRNTGKRRALNN